MSAAAGGGVLERRVEFSPAFDKRHVDPRKNYGVHGVDLRMYLIGPEGAVQFVLYTDWHLPHVDAELRAKGSRIQPTPADLGYHSRVPQYEDQASRDDCHLLGGPCYYDGSCLNAERIYDVLLREGSDGVWRELEAYYREIFPAQAAALSNIEGGK
mgnify:CR=1 FL=1